MPTEARRAGVLGSPVTHSLSPVLHLAAYRALGLTDWTYDRIECDADRLPGLVSSLGPEWTGLSVTMPGKSAALAVASSASPMAVAVGVANTLVRQDSGSWHADCTDVDGVVGALRAAGGYVPVPDAAGLILGAGGTASAALAGLAALGISRATVVMRDVTRAGTIAACASRLGLPLDVIAWSSADFATLASSAAVLVSTTPSSAVTPLADSLSLAGCVLDVIYHPWPTPLASAVLSRGRPVATGLDMLLHQAFAQVTHFTGLEAPRSAMRSALRAQTGNTLDLPLA